MKVYRITRDIHIKDDLKGIGASVAPGRWNKKDIFCIYTAETRALAQLEHLANVTKENYINSSFILRTFFIPDNCIIKIDVRKLPLDWRVKPPPVSTREFGTTLLQSNQKLAYMLPSVIIPQEFNIIIDPHHPDIKKLSLLNDEILYYDSRLKN